MKWHQRSLQSMTLSDGTVASFQYNAEGIRTKKTVGTAVHNYVLDGSTILKETVTTGSATTTLYYYYDESGISGLEYNGTKYTYVKNLQGDVIGIIDSYGATVVEYKYDAWGNILSVTGSMASTLGATNPFRYRGYYYDTESGWYYLNSRYYDPQVGRFLNADSIIGANGGLMGYNMFSYCNDNPVMFSDPNGEGVLIWIAVGFITVCLTSCSSGKGEDTKPSVSSSDDADLNDVDPELEEHLYGEQGVHWFNSYREAVNAAIKSVEKETKKSIADGNNYEHCCIVYQGYKGRYYVSITYSDLDNGKVGYRANLVPSDGTALASIHSHTRNSSYKFSSKDVETALKYGIDMYVTVFSSGTNIGRYWLPKGSRWDNQYVEYTGYMSALSILPRMPLFHLIHK